MITKEFEARLIKAMELIQKSDYLTALKLGLISFAPTLDEDEAK